MGTGILDTYSLEQAENDLAALKGQVQMMTEHQQIGSIIIDANSGTNGTGEIVIDAWHQFNPLSNSWSLPGAGYANYRLTPENELQIDAWIKSPGSSTVNGVTICTFPAGYRPLTTKGFPVAADLLPSSVNASPMMTITSAGVMQSTGVGGNPGNANVYIQVKIPLDT